MFEERIISIIDRINRLGGYVPEPVEFADPPPVVKPPSPSHLPSRAWSPEDDDKLRKYWLVHSNSRLGVMFGRTSGAVRKRARRLGLPRKTRCVMPHNEDRDRDIADAIERGERLASIGRRYGISRERVRQIGLKLGVRTTGYRISEDEAAQIVAQYRRGLSPAHIETHRSQYTVYDVLIRAGMYLPNPGASLWTPREDQILMREWGKKSSREIGALIGRSKNAVIGRAYRLRLAEAAHA